MVLFKPLDDECLFLRHYPNTAVNQTRMVIDNMFAGAKIADKGGKGRVGDLEERSARKQKEEERELGFCLLVKEHSALLAIIIVTIFFFCCSSILNFFYYSFFSGKCNFYGTLHKLIA